MMSIYILYEINNVEKKLPKYIIVIFSLINNFTLFISLFINIVPKFRMKFHSECKFELECKRKRGSGQKLDTFDLTTKKSLLRNLFSYTGKIRIRFYC